MEILNSNSFVIDREGARHTVLKKKINGKVLTTFVGRHSEVIATEIHYIIRQTQKPREEFLK